MVSIAQNLIPIVRRGALQHQPLRLLSHLSIHTVRPFAPHNAVATLRGSSIASMRLPIKCISPQVGQVRTKTLLATGLAMGIFHTFRTVATTLPVLWRWGTFKKYPRLMKALTGSLIVGVATLFLIHTEQHPMTNRVRLMFVDEETEAQIAEEGFAEMMREAKGKVLPATHPWYERTKKITDRLVKVVGEDLKDWELIVVNDPEIQNAMVLPNGKIFVYTGMMDIIMLMCYATQGKLVEKDVAFAELNPSFEYVPEPWYSGFFKFRLMSTKKPIFDPEENTLFDHVLAAILAHETAHVLSRHGAESIGVDYLHTAVRDTAHSFLYTVSMNLPMLADVSGRGVDMLAPLLIGLPHSRRRESEADVIGLFLMAVAGYNPSHAKDFWKFLAAIEFETQKQELLKDEQDKDAVLAEGTVETVTRILEFASTHPSHDRRAADLEKHEESAMEIYNVHLKVEEALKNKLSDPALAGEKGVDHLDHVDAIISEVLRDFVSTHDALWYAK
ncbi:UNVERIFIED_CONTAM: hypothetical protein HDU68_004415, partial [Siphonaria sp. JEL0065]